MLSEEAALSQEHGTKPRHRLVAILAADAAGYSRLMASDEQRTMAALDAARAVFREQIEAHNGRVVDMAGDSVLAVFETATGAVSAALDVQQRLEALVTGVPADRRMRFRIGVHLGDVFEKADGTVYGDGVNIAARLEGLAVPGGVTVSDAVQGAVRHRVAAAFEDLGEQQVKNIVDPVRAYRVLTATNGGALAKRSWLTWMTPLTSGRRSWQIGAAVVLSALSLGALAWLIREAALGGGVVPITMSLAIGSIVAPSDDAATAQAAEALTQNLSPGLGAVERSVRIVSLARQANATATLRDVALAAGARYVVEGDLQTASPRRALNLRLVDTGRGTQEWSGRFDLPGTLDSVDTQIANRKVVGQLARGRKSRDQPRPGNAGAQAQLNGIGRARLGPSRPRYVGGGRERGSEVGRRCVAPRTDASACAAYGDLRTR